MGKIKRILFTLCEHKEFTIQCKTSKVMETPKEKTWSLREVEPHIGKLFRWDTPSKYMPVATRYGQLDSVVTNADSTHSLKFTNVTTLYPRSVQMTSVCILPLINDTVPLEAALELTTFEDLKAALYATFKDILVDVNIFYTPHAHDGQSSINSIIEGI